MPLGRPICTAYSTIVLAITVPAGDSQQPGVFAIRIRFRVLPKRTTVIETLFPFPFAVGVVYATFGPPRGRQSAAKPIPRDSRLHTVDERRVPMKTSSNQYQEWAYDEELAESYS